MIALVWEESLERMLGMLPSGDLRIPTCSAEEEKEEKKQKEEKGQPDVSKISVILQSL